MSEADRDELIAALRIFAYEIAGISEVDDETLLEVASRPNETNTVRQLGPAVVNARALLARLAPKEQK